MPAANPKWDSWDLISIREAGNCPVVTGPVLGWLLGITPQRIRQLTKLGLPRLAHGLYPLLADVRWYIHYSKTCGTVRRRSKIKERSGRARLKLLEIQVQQVTGSFVERELLDGRKCLVKLLDRQLAGLVWEMGREFEWSEEQILAVRRKLDTMRNNVVGESDQFIAERIPY